MEILEFSLQVILACRLLRCCSYLFCRICCGRILSDSELHRSHLVFASQSCAHCATEGRLDEVRFLFETQIWITAHAEAGTHSFLLNQSQVRSHAERLSV